MKLTIKITTVIILLTGLYSCTKNTDTIPTLLYAETKNNSTASCNNTYTCSINQFAMVQRDSAIGGGVLYANNSYSNYASFKTESWITSTHIFDSRSLVKFNLPSNFFSGFTFCSADLLLYEDIDPNCLTWLGIPNPYLVSQNPGNAARILRVKTSWSPATATWNNQPLYALANSAIVPAISTPQLSINADNQVVNVTNLMLDVQAAGVNRGIAIALPAVYPSLRARQFGGVNTMPALQVQLVFHY